MVPPKVQVVYRSVVAVVRAVVEAGSKMSTPEVEDGKFVEMPDAPLDVQVKYCIAVAEDAGAVETADVA